MVKAGKTPTEMEVQRTLEFVQDRSRFTIRPSQAESIRMMMSFALDLIPMLHGMNWYLLRWAEPLLFTGDSPVTCWHEGTGEGQFYGQGPATSDLFRFPLDRRHALVLGHEGPDEQVRDGTNEEAAEVNANVLLAADEWVFDYPSGGRLSPEVLLARAREEFGDLPSQ